MPATTFAAIAALEMKSFGKDNQSILHIVIYRVFKIIFPFSLICVVHNIPDKENLKFILLKLSR
jgi:hypothetical protein